MKRFTIFAALLLATATLSANAAEIARKSLVIEGLIFEIETPGVVRPADTPAVVQTLLGGKKNEAAPSIGGAIAKGELRGGSLSAPVTLSTEPGYAFQIPPLSKGSYVLENIRMVTAQGELMQYAFPIATVPITITDGLATSVTVTQLTAEALRARGITLDARNFDVFGRVTERTYADGTFERYNFEGPRLVSKRDRRGAVVSIQYDTLGRVSAICDNVPLCTDGAPKLKTFTYDVETGRLVKAATPDAEIEYLDYTAEGLPQKTIQRRLNGGATIDAYEQSHTWNERGERTSWTMPSYADLATTLPWTKKLYEERDAAGNLTSIKRDLFDGTNGSVLLTGNYRATGAPVTRTVSTYECAIVGSACTSKSIVRTYGYDAKSALPTSLLVTSKGIEVAGSKDITYDGTQIATTTLAALSGETRANEYDYDERSRLVSSKIAGEAISLDSTETLTKADFREALMRPATSVFPSMSFAEQTNDAHKLRTLTRGTSTFNFDYRGGDRYTDGRFRYEFDALGRLIRVTELAGAISTGRLRRIRYFYDANDRRVGRRAESAPYVGGAEPEETAWQLETDPNILASDALPADVTFVWGLDDRLISLFRADASQMTGADVNGGLIRQIIHGDSSYDDPIEVTTLDPTAPRGVGHFYPVYDEAASGNLQVIINEAGEVVTRAFADGAYGEDEFVLNGAAVDNVSIVVKKDDAGELENVVVRLRVTEKIKADTLQQGVRLAAVDNLGGVVRTSSAVPSVVDEFTAEWTLTPAQWTALSSSDGSAVAISVAATDSLRVQAWDDGLPVLPAPDWARATRPIFSTPAIPVEVREQFSVIDASIAALTSNSSDTIALYEVPELSAIGAPRLFGGSVSDVTGDVLRLTGLTYLHAYPLQEPATGLICARSRWYDPATGTFLTADPELYADSSNLYSAFAGDPVNKRDPLGTRVRTAQDVADLNALKLRGKRLHDDFKTTGRATFVEWQKVAVEQPWWDTSGPLGGDFKWIAVPVEIANEQQYQAARRLLIEDVASFEAAVARADDDGEILYLPGSGFTTRTRDDIDTAEAWTAALTVGFITQDVITMRSGRGGTQMHARRGKQRTGMTPGGMRRNSKEWRRRFGDASMRDHHLVPQALLKESAFTQRLAALGVKDAKTFVDRRIARITNAKHEDIHSAGWNKAWKSWLDANPNFTIRDLDAQVNVMIRQYNIPRSSRNFTKSYGKN